MFAIYNQQSIRFWTWRKNQIREESKPWQQLKAEVVCAEQKQFEEGGGWLWAAQLVTATQDRGQGVLQLQCWSVAALPGIPQDKNFHKPINSCPKSLEQLFK